MVTRPLKWICVSHKHNHTHYFFYLNIFLLVFSFPFVLPCRLFNRLVWLKAVRVYKNDNMKIVKLILILEECLSEHILFSWHIRGECGRAASVQTQMLSNLVLLPQSAMLAVLLVFDSGVSDAAGDHARKRLPVSARHYRLIERPRHAPRLLQFTQRNWVFGFKPTQV